MPKEEARENKEEAEVKREALDSEEESF
jgi:hypothetical protein